MSIKTPLMQALAAYADRRFPPLESTDLIMRRLDESTQCLVASPTLVTAALSSLGDFAGLPSLDLGSPHREHHWRLGHDDGQEAVIPHRRVSSPTTWRHCAKQRWSAWVSFSFRP